MYDDSGSMEGDRWVNANYAMQAFAAMLNKEDTLYISYMSENGGSGDESRGNSSSGDKSCGVSSGGGGDISRG